MLKRIGIIAIIGLSCLFVACNQDSDSSMQMPLAQPLTCDQLGLECAAGMSWHDSDGDGIQEASEIDLLGFPATFD